MVYVTFKFVLRTCDIPNSEASETHVDTKAPGTRPFHTCIHFTWTCPNGIIVPSHQQYPFTPAPPVHLFIPQLCGAAPHLEYLFPWCTGRLVMACRRRYFWFFYFSIFGSTWVWTFSLLFLFYVSISGGNKASCHERWC